MINNACVSCEICPENRAALRRGIINGTAVSIFLWGLIIGYGVGMFG